MSEPMDPVVLERAKSGSMRIHQLTHRERQWVVDEMTASGYTSAQIAGNLGTSKSTVQRLRRSGRQ